MKLLHLTSCVLFNLLVGCNPVVDGQCADGYEPCGGACVHAGTCRAWPAGACPDPAPGPQPQTDSDAGALEEPVAPCGDVSSDPLNCGTCGNVCATAVCVEGVCQGARAGDVVVIGHDFVDAAPKLAMSDVAVNAVFMRPRSQVRVLSWQQYADPAAVAGLGRVLDAEVKRTGRRYVKSVASSAHDFAARISIDEFDVALVFDQANAHLGELEVQGAALAAPLRKFAEDGGVVVVLDGGRGVGEMPRFLTAAGVAAVTSQTDASGATLDLVAPADAVGTGVMAPYKATGGTVALTIGDPFAAFATVVAEPVTGKPIVLHRTVHRAGKEP